MKPIVIARVWALDLKHLDDSMLTYIIWHLNDSMLTYIISINPLYFAFCAFGAEMRLCERRLRLDVPSAIFFVKDDECR